MQVSPGTGPVTVEPPIGLCVADESLPICLYPHRYPPGTPPYRTEHHSHAHEKERTKEKEQQIPTAEGLSSCYSGLAATTSLLAPTSHLVMLKSNIFRK
jgi:hypothetical protein